MFYKLVISFVVVCVLRETKAGNSGPYLTGFESAGQVGPNSGFAGSALIAPLAAEGFNSPRERYPQNNAFPGNPTGVGFGGFGWRNSQTTSGYSSGSGGSGSSGSRGSGSGTSGGQY